MNFVRKPVNNTEIKNDNRSQKRQVCPETAENQFDLKRGYISQNPLLFDVSK